MKRVVIEAAEMDLIERLFFKYNAAKDIVSFLMSKEEINAVALREYMDTTEQRFIELELAKRELVAKYGGDPDNFYSFIFSTNTLEYTEV